jgi:hypothetical protein
MEHITKASLKQLLEVSDKLTEREQAVTIYVSTHKSATPSHITEDQIRLKNCVHRAVELLKMHSDTADYSKMLCAELARLIDDPAFWSQRTEGLLLCATPHTIKLFSLPMDTQEYVAVDNHLHLAPIMALAQADQDFYILLVAQHGPALYKGNMYNLEPTDIQLPKSIEAGLNLDETNLKSEQGRSAGGGPGATFNGRGGAKDPAEEDRARFMRMIDHIILTKANRALPLILAGTTSETAEYHAISKYPQILPQTITGNFNHESIQELYAKAEVVIYRTMARKHNHEVLDRYARVKGSNPTRVASSTQAAAEAAGDGRIDTLLVGMSRFTADNIHDGTEDVLEIAFPETDEVNHFVNNIALQAGNSSSQVLNIPQEDMPGGAPVLAILRY